VEIRQSYTTTVEIPAPGMITINAKQPGVGSLYQLTPSGNQVWVLNLLEERKTQSFLLQPGRYRIIYRRGDMHSTSESMMKDFIVREGTPETISFY
jgi:Ca-activated chloride channel family protein